MLCSSKNGNHAALDEFQRRITNWVETGAKAVTTIENSPDAGRQHMRETLNTIIDLLEPLTPQQRQDVIISAAAAVSVKVTVPTPPASRGGYRAKPKRGY